MIRLEFRRTLCDDRIRPRRERMIARDGDDVVVGTTFRELPIRKRDRRCAVVVDLDPFMTAVSARRIVHDLGYHRLREYGMRQQEYQRDNAMNPYPVHDPRHFDP